MERENREEGERVSDNKRWPAVSPLRYWSNCFFLSHMFRCCGGANLSNVEQLSCEEGD